MASPAWNGIKITTPLFGLTNDLSSAPIPIPTGAQTVTIHEPDLKNATTYKLQSLFPPVASDTTAVWRDLKWVNDDGSLAVAVVNALSGLGSTSGCALVLKDAQFGAGTIRITVSAAQDAQVQFTLFFELVK